jgi:hypothetical protein
MDAGRGRFLTRCLFPLANPGLFGFNLCYDLRTQPFAVPDPQSTGVAGARREVVLFAAHGSGHALVRAPQTKFDPQNGAGSLRLSAANV